MADHLYVDAGVSVADVQRKVLSDSVEARALAMLKRYLDMHPLNECCEVTARGAYLTGVRDFYPRGAADMQKACANLASALGQFRSAVAELEHLVEMVGAAEQ